MPRRSKTRPANSRSPGRYTISTWFRRCAVSVTVVMPSTVPRPAGPPTRLRDSGTSDVPDPLNFGTRVGGMGSSAEHVAAGVDDHRLAGDRAGLVAGEEQRQVGDVVRRRDVAQGHA